MDKQEYLQFLGLIRSEYQAGNYEVVATYADQLDFKKVKDAKTLEMISDSYARLNEPDNAIEALLAASDINTNSRQIAYKLCELSIQLNDLESAVEFYEEYCSLSNNAPDRYILKYEIGKADGIELSELIKVLEAYNSREKDEKWEYELAKAYHDAGKVDKCVATCDDICLWYADGEYVKKALELKFSHVALSPSQQRLYESMMQEYLDPEEMTPEEVKTEEPEDFVANQLASEYLGEGQGEEPVVAQAQDVDFSSLIAGIAEETQAQANKEANAVNADLVQEESVDQEEVLDAVWAPVNEEKHEYAFEEKIMPAKEESLEDTRVLSISEIVKQLELEEISAQRVPAQPADEASVQENLQEQNTMETELAADSDSEEAAVEAARPRDEFANVDFLGMAENLEEDIAREGIAIPEEEIEATPVEEEIAQVEETPKAAGFVLPDEKSASITMDQLRMMIHEGNRKKAESGVFFTYNEPTEEDIAEEAAQKAEREAAIEAARLAREREIEEKRLARERAIEEARLEREREKEEQRLAMERELEEQRIAREKELEAQRLAEEAALEAEREAARRAAEEEAAREAALASAREAQRLEEETRIEEVMKQAEEQRIIAAQNDFDTAKIPQNVQAEEDMFAEMADEVADQVVAGAVGFDAAVAAAELTAKEDIPEDLENEMADEFAQLFAQDEKEEPKEVSDEFAQLFAQDEKEEPKEVSDEFAELFAQDAKEEPKEANDEFAELFADIEIEDEPVNQAEVAADLAALAGIGVAVGAVVAENAETEEMSIQEPAAETVEASAQEPAAETVEASIQEPVVEEVVEASVPELVVEEAQKEESVITESEAEVYIEPWDEYIDPDGDIDETQFISRDEIGKRLQQADEEEELFVEAAEEIIDEVIDEAPIQDAAEEVEASIEEAAETSAQDAVFDELLAEESLQDIIDKEDKASDVDFDSLFGDVDVELAEDENKVTQEEDPEVAAFLAGLGMAGAAVAAKEVVEEVVEEAPAQEAEIAEGIIDEVTSEAPAQEAEAAEEIIDEVTSEAPAQETEAADEIIDEVTSEAPAQEAEAAEEIIDEVIEEAPAQEAEAAQEVIEEAEVASEVMAQENEMIDFNTAAEQVAEAEMPENVAAEEDYSSIKIDSDAIMADIALEGLLNEPDEVVVAAAVDSAPVDEVVVNGSDITATQVFSKIDFENDSALDSHFEEKLLTPEERLGAAIQRILMKSKEVESVAAEETKSIRVVIPKACAGKLGVSNSRVSAFASSVVKPKLANDADENEEEKNVQEESLRIIDNVDFSYIPIANEDDGQLGLNIDALSTGEEFAVEGQMSITDVLENFNAETNKFEEPEKVVSEEEVVADRLRQIQQAVDLTSPVQLPYAMDDLMFDDIEVTDVNGNAEEVEGDVFALKAENIGLVGTAEEEQAPKEPEWDPFVIEEETVDDILDVLDKQEVEAEEEKPHEEDPEVAAFLASVGYAGVTTAAVAAAETVEEAAVATEEIAEEAAENAEPKELTEAEKAIEEFEKAAQQSEEPSEVQDELFDVMAELEAMETPVAENEDISQEILEGDAFDEVFESFMSDEQNLDDETISAEAMNEVQAQVGYVMPESVREGVAEFLLCDGMEAQITGTICNIVDIKRNGDVTGGNLIVTGDIKSGKTFLAIEVIKAVSEELGIENGKVAKVQAELLNGKNIEKVFEKISGSDLIIENVGLLSDNVVKDMTRVMKSGKINSMVVIEGNQLAVESLFNTFPEFAAQFENRLDINELSIVQWADLAIKYADEKGYVLDDMAKLALHAKINEINLPTVRLGYDKIKNVIDQAIERAERRNSGKLFSAFSKRNETVKREMIESDFI